MRQVYAAVCFEGNLEELLKDVEQRVVTGVERIRAGVRAFPPDDMHRRQLENTFYEKVEWPRNDRRYFLMRDPAPFME
jgi:hypothetical protein